MFKRTISSILLVMASFTLLPGQNQHTGVLQGAKYLIVAPESWSGKLLMVAHGYVPEQMDLSPDFSPEKEIYQELVNKGWMVAGTSYRRNGIIIKDAIKDLENLHDHISESFGKPSVTLLQGSSMGGVIGTLIAENPKRRFNGVLNMGAALNLETDVENIKFSYKPRIPILFLSNQSEYQAPQAYIENLKSGRAVLWKVSRDGHVNVNQEEQKLALKALQDLVEGRKLPTYREVTIQANPASTAEFRKEGAFTRIAWVDPVYGNLYTELIPADLKQLKVRKGEHFQLSYKRHQYNVFYGTTYNDVPTGEWVTFLSGEGTFQISCNYCNAAKMLDYQKGDRIFISK